MATKNLKYYIDLMVKELKIKEYKIKPNLSAIKPTATVFVKKDKIEVCHEWVKHNIPVKFNCNIKEL